MSLAPPSVTPRPSPSHRLRVLIQFDQDVAHSGRVKAVGGHESTLPRCSAEDGPIRPMRLAGFDEAGRGALAGPVVVGCVHLPIEGSRRSLYALQPDVLETLSWLDDSKRVTARRRERLFDVLFGIGQCSVGCASAREIDDLGIVTACRLAAQRAWRRLGVDAELLLFDRSLSLGTAEPSAARRVELTSGDARSLHIAAASIVAKVSRDALMCRLSSRAPVYGFEGHKGYGTTAHRRALAAHGPGPFHRRTFLRKILNTG